MVTVMMSNSKDRLGKLEIIEQQLCASLQSAGQSLSELSKDKPSMKNVETQVTQFLKTLETVEVEISKQINYLTQVSTGQPHEGSSYASQKVLHMAWHRLEHSRSRINELERLKTNHQMQLQQLQQNSVIQPQVQHQQQITPSTVQFQQSQSQMPLQQQSFIK